jgi:probable F420-dependent oxidoreductase
VTRPKLGAVFPQGEFAWEADAIRAYTLAVEELGLSQLVAYDHVLGAGLGTRPDWSGWYSAENAFHEPFVLFSHLAALTTQLEFATCILVLPQRQTALVAKQAAELHLLSGGRFRLGIGSGWNDVEYEGLGVPFEKRAERLEEQIGVLRALWSSPTVDVDAKYHRIRDAGINPLPDRPIPIWMGGGETTRSLDRIARLADGWMIPDLLAAEAVPAIAEFQRVVASHSRDPNAVGLEGRVLLHKIPREQWRAEAEAWMELGVSRVNIFTGRLGLRSLDEHLDVLRSVSSEL